MQTLGGVTTSYGYGTASDLLGTESVGGTVIQTIGYTADGRMASFSPGIQAPGGQYITALSYNQDAQLSAVNAGGQALASYTYDAFGQRMLKTFSGTSGEIYQYGQNGTLLEETDQSGAAQADYIYLNGRPIADLAPSTGTLYFLHDDMLGTPQLGADGQSINLTINGTTTPWIWSVVEFDSNGNPIWSDHSIFPTFSVYVNGKLTQTLNQTDLQTFDQETDKYERIPDDIQ